MIGSIEAGMGKGVRRPADSRLGQNERQLLQGREEERQAQASGLTRGASWTKRRGPQSLCAKVSWAVLEGRDRHPGDGGEQERMFWRQASIS
jgi:hypothetical protein